MLTKHFAFTMYSWLKHHFPNFIIPIFYLIAGLLWINLSDSLMYWLSNIFNWNTVTLEFISISKGYFYVVVTAILLYVLICAQMKSLVRTKNDFINLFENHPNPMWIYETLSKKILLANNAACEEYGYSQNEFKALNLTDLLEKNHSSSIQKSDNNNLEAPDFRGDWLFKTKAGNPFYAKVYSHETEYEHRHCTIMLSIDINKKLVAELDKLNIENALHNSTIVSITDIQGIISDVSVSFCRVSKYSREELIGKPHNIVSSHFHPKEFWVDMWRTITAGKTWRGEIKNRNKLGETYWVYTVINPVFDQNNKIYKFISVRYDITHRKELEETQSLLLRDLHEYSFQTSHELRGPLTTLMGLTNLFNEYEDKAFVIDKIRETASEVDTVIRKMNSTLNRNNQFFKDFSHQIEKENKLKRSQKFNL